MNHWYLGTIGFSYKDWVGSFYPPGTTQRGYLSYYSKVFNAVELDTTFYSIPNQKTVQSWFISSPTDFQFCLKTPRRITHELGLRGAQGLMLEFIDSLYNLREKLGPILIQLPPSYTQDNYSVLSDFLAALPPIRLYAIEFRHSSWYNERTTALLSHHQVCWVSTEFPNLPMEINLTANFLYIRWIGINGMYHHHTHERVDKSNDLRWWLKSINQSSENIPNVYGFFNNDYAGFAAGTCKRFKRIIGLNDEENNLPYQAKLFLS
jgi:uncharacterized protein YecE (DUF72 family)